ncbi:sacsin N-terminal ATP-binding-like domain-containing protein, partial [Vibrio alginolyticus]
MTPKQQLLEYRKTKYHIQESSGESMLGDDIKIDLHNSVQVLSEQLYSKDVHFVFELIQNAEDNHYAVGVEPKLHFELLDIDPTGTAGTKGCLAIYNNELGFELKNVKAVSSVGGSTKKNSKDSGYIGEKGIGFKSVFSVTPSPHIYSNGFQFSFRDSDEKTGLGYIIPYWEERVPEVVQKNLGTYNTCILLPLRDDPELDCLLKIRQELDNLDASLLLFLNKISDLTVHLDGSTRRYSKEEHESYTSLINESEGNTKTTDYIV